MAASTSAAAGAKPTSTTPAAGIGLAIRDGRESAEPAPEGLQWITTGCLISGFVDAYLSLTMEQERDFETELQLIQPQVRERVMEIVTSWGKKAECKLVLRQLRKRFGTLDRGTEERIEALPPAAFEELGEALLDFRSPDDLVAWLAAHG